MIGEQGPGEDLETRCRTDRLEPGEKVISVPVALEDHLPVETSDHYVMEGPGQVKAWPTRHVGSLAVKDKPVQKYPS